MVNILQKRVTWFNILNINMPEDAQEERTGKNNNDQLEHSVELDDQKSMENRVGKQISVIPISDVIFQLFRVVFINDLFELFNI